MDRHYTVSIFVVNNQKVLLHKHKKANILLPVGGHIEKNELPQEAAIRETVEEAGLEVILYDKDQGIYEALNTEKEKVLINPMHMVWGEIEEGHEHIDFVFYAQSSTASLKPGVDESDHVKWYSEEELDQLKEVLLADIYRMAKEAINTFKG